MKLTLMMAQSADGFIAKHHHHFPDWTCSADKKLFKKMTQNAGVLIMGGKTYATIGKPLRGRLNVVYTRHPEQYHAHEDVMLTSLAPERLLDELQSRGYSDIILTGGAEINSLFAGHQLIDEIMLTISPIIFGRGVSLFSQATEMNLSLMGSMHLDENTLFLHYRVEK
jgi:dihydrofolate reductase